MQIFQLFNAQSWCNRADAFYKKQPLGVVLGLLALLAVAACDNERIAKLEEDVSTQEDVLAQFGKPEQVWDGEEGQRIFEYSRQPYGTENYMITIAANGTMVSLRQVLNPDSFARVQAGMPMEAVRKMLGKPAKITPYPLAQTTHYDWRYKVGTTDFDRKIFTVIFNEDLRVVSTHSSDDRGEENAR